MNKKSFKKYIYYILLSAVLIGSAIGVFFSTSAGETFIKNRMGEALSQAIGQNVVIDELNIVFPAVVNIRGVNITTQNNERESLLKIRKIETSIELLPILKRQLSLKYLKLDGLVVDIKRGRDGDIYIPLLDNIPASEPSGTPGKFKFKVGDIDIFDSSLRIEGEEKEAGLHLEGMNFSIVPKNETVGFKGRVSSGEISYNGDFFPLNYIEIEGETTGSRIKIENFNLGALGMEISASGEKIEDGSMEGIVNFSGDIMEPARILPVAAPPGQLKGKGEVQFSFVPPKNIKISEFSFEGPAGKLTGTGRYDGKRAELKIDASRLVVSNLAELFGRQELCSAGVGELTAVFRGDPARSKSWKIETSARASNLVCFGKDVPDLRLEANFQDSRGRAKFQSEILKGAADFTYVDKALNADFKLSEVSLGELSEYFSFEGPTGSLQINGSVKDFPKNTRIEAEIESRDLKFGEFRFKEVKLNAEYSGSVLQLSSFKATAGTAAVLSGHVRADLKKLAGSFKVDIDDSASGQISSVSGSFRREDGTIVIEASEEGMDLARILKIIPGEFNDYGGILSWEGSASLKEGELAEGGLSFNWEDPQFNQYVFSNITGRTALSGERVTIPEIEIYEGPNSASLRDGVFFLKKAKDKIAFDRTRPIMGEVTVDDIDIEAVSDTFDLPFYLSGRSNGTVKVSGTPKKPELAGNIDIRDGTFRRRGSDITAKDIDGSIKIEESVIELKKLTGKIEGAPFKFSGRADKAGKDDWSLDLAGSSGQDGRILLAGKVSPQKVDMELTLDEFSLFLLQPFIEGVSVLDGAINGNLVIRGQLAAPTLRGTIRGEGINIRTQELIEPAKNIKLKIDFTENTITVVQLSGKFSSGKFSVSGNISYSPDGLEAVDLSAEGSGMGFNIPNIGTTKIDKANLNFSGNESYLFKGDIFLKEFRITADRIIPAVEGRREKGLADKISLQLKITGQRNVWMDNRFGRVRNSLDINIGGTLASPVIAGQLTAVEGYVYYLDRKFRIKKGGVNFTDPVATKAVLDIEAQTVIIPVGADSGSGNEYTVTVYISGEASDPDIELQSRPSLAPAEIVSLLTFGVTSKQLSGEGITGRESDIGEVLQERAQALTSKRITGLFTGEVETFLNLDEFAIEGDIFRYGTGGGPRVVATKQIFPRTEVTYSSDIGNTNERKVRLGYRISDNFLLESTNESLGSTSIGLKYRLMLR